MFIIIFLVVALPSYNDLVRTDSPGVGTSHSPGGTVFRAPDGTTVNLPAGLRRAQSPSTAPPGGQSAASTPHDPCTGCKWKLFVFWTCTMV